LVANNLYQKATTTENYLIIKNAKEATVTHDKHEVPEKEKVVEIKLPSDGKQRNVLFSRN